MKPTARFLLGVLVGAAGVWGASILLSLLAIWSPWPHAWWSNHFFVAVIESEVIVLLPTVVVLAFLFSRIYRTRPALSAFLSMTVAVVITSFDTLRHPDQIAVTARITWGFFVPLLLGPPVLICLGSLMRSNNRWRGP